MRSGIRRHRYPPLLLAAVFIIQTIFAVVAHAAPTAIDDPAYTAKILDGSAQFKAIGFTRDLPNPLMPAYVYNEMCVANPNNPLCNEGELEPNEGGEQELGVDWYDMTMREITHSNAGLVDDQSVGKPFLIDPVTGLPGFRVRTYGPTSNPALNAYPARTIVAHQGRAVKIVWRNELKTPFFLPVDKTMMCGPEGKIAPANCPDNAAVVHVHGGHGFDHSDGLPEQWFTPVGANGLPAQTGTLWRPNNRFGPEQTASPIGTFVYPMDVEASTVWYHDHATGITRLNAMAGLAGFLLIRDNNETAMQQFNATSNPPVAPKLPSYPYEVPIAVQDHVFWGETVPGTKAVLGQMAVPDQPLACVPRPGYSCPAVIPNTPSIVPEFFGNIPLTNGVAWPKLNVEPRKYRLRLLNACDSRTLILRLAVAGTTIDDPPTPIPGAPITIIGSEQGFLNSPLTWTQPLVIMPGQRYDVVVDFGNALYSGKKLVLQNIGPDMPFRGDIPDPANTDGYVPTDPSTTGQIMQFIVDKPLGFYTQAQGMVVPDAVLPTSLRAQSTSGPYPATPAVPAGTAVHRSFLKEALDQYNRVKLTMDYQGLFDGVTELPAFQSTQVWEIANLTPDSHPMHLHLVKFRLLNREEIKPADYNAILAAPLLRTAPAPAPPVYSGTGVTTAPRAYEAGYIDTVECPPGQITRIVATFDIPGLYVWHCHILQHEEFDMMREFAVTMPAKGVKIYSNLPQNTILIGSSPIAATFTAEAQTGFGDTHLPGTETDYPSTTLAYEYRFSVKIPGGSYIVEQAWSRQQTFARSFGTAGIWRVKVEARQLGGTYAQATNETVINAVSNAPVDLSLKAPIPASQTAGTPVPAKFTATGFSAPDTPGPGPYEYQFSLAPYPAPHSGSWSASTIKQAFSTANTWTWTPLANQVPGIFEVRADIRTAGSPALAQPLFTKFVTYTVLGPKPSGVSLSVSGNTWKQPLTPVMSQVTFTGNGSPNGGTYEYKFTLTPPSGTVTKRDWSTTRTFNWVPPKIAGRYTIQVEVRQVGSTATTGAKAINSFIVY
jgi:spore coat protein A, manganese oxidase